ncbi:beta-galactosidase [Metabacillus indicus]|uniref:beta-galactosidase n=1 Tax=Metabacillus indicus TaxID=246786 RepID=UPI003CEB47BB
MYLGVDYYPEHWDPSLFGEDIEKMKEMGVNMVRIGEFAWHLMEPEEGKCDFSFFDGVIKRFKEEGIAVMFGTPTATFPAWLVKKHPDILLEDEHGHPKSFGGRRQYCYNSKTYQTYSLAIVEKLVTHYQDESGIVSWQIDNELGHEGSDMCYCGECREAFHRFLERKYETAEELNKRWGTIFWGQTYNAFDEVPVPKPTITVHNPAMMLDWARFRSESLSSFAKMHLNLVKKLKGSHQEVTTNLPGGFFGKWFDHNEFSRELDFVSYDNYPVWGGLTKPVSPAFLSFTLGFVRGIKRENFWIVEQLMGAQGHDIIGYLPRPGQAQLWSYHAFAHGCSNMLYFRFRGMNRGAEQYCLGILDADNTRSRKFYEVQEVFKEVRKHEEVFQAPIEADVAVLYDFDNVWSMRIQQQSSQLEFTNELMRLYQPFHDVNVPVDVLRYDHDFSSYKVVLVPVLTLVDDELAARLKAFAENGGTVIFSFRAGMKNKDNNIPFGEKTPYQLKDLLGIEIDEAESLHGGQHVSIVSADSKTEASGSVWRDLVRPAAAETLYTYSDRFYKNYAAVTVNKFGEGKAYYVGTGAEEKVLGELALSVLNESGISYIESAPGVEVVIRGEHAIVMNHNDEDAVFEGEALQPFETKILARSKGGHTQ